MNSSRHCAERLSHEWQREWQRSLVHDGRRAADVLWCSVSNGGCRRGLLRKLRERRRRARGALEIAAERERWVDDLRASCRRRWREAERLRRWRRVDRVDARLVAELGVRAALVRSGWLRRRCKRARHWLRLRLRDDRWCHRLRLRHDCWLWYEADARRSDLLATERWRWRWHRGGSQAVRWRRSEASRRDCRRRREGRRLLRLRWGTVAIRLCGNWCRSATSDGYHGGLAPRWRTSRSSTAAHHGGSWVAGRRRCAHTGLRRPGARSGDGSSGRLARVGGGRIGSALHARDRTRDGRAGGRASERGAREAWARGDDDERGARTSEEKKQRSSSTSATTRAACSLVVRACVVRITTRCHVVHFWSANGGYVVILWLLRVRLARECGA